MEPTKVISIVLEVIIISSLLLASFIILIIYFRHKRNEQIKETILREKEYQHSLFQSQIEVQEATFSALGKELHDNIGQLLGSTKMLIVFAQKNLDPIPEALISAHDTIGIAIKELRSLAKSLDKEWLKQFNLIENLQTEVERLNASNSFQINFTHPENLMLPSEEQIILFRIVQESLQNAIKHSGASTINITINASSIISIDICDDGSGFNEKLENKNGMGLLNMRHRTKLLGGTIKWNAAKCSGTSVTIELPAKTLA